MSILDSLDSRYVNGIDQVYVPTENKFNDFLETSQHLSCCQKKEVNGIKYEHIYDHGMVVPSGCKDHCVYKKVVDTEDMHYCFGVGNLTAKCLEAPGHGECNSVVVSPTKTGKKYYTKRKSKHFVNYLRSSFVSKNWRK